MSKISDSNEQEVRASLGDAMHELRKFGAAILANATEISKKINIDAEGKPLSLSLGSDKADILRDHVTTIQHTVELLFARLDLVDVEIDPAQFEKAQRIQIGIYSKFDKAKKVLREIAKKRRVRIKFDGQSHRKETLFPVFDILPFLLLDNAVKYAPSDTEVLIEFIELKDCTHVTVSSLGPEVRPDELPRLTEKWYRGDNAKALTKDGSGFGLYFSKFICDMQGIGFDLSQRGDSFKFNSVPYKRFVVELRIPH